MKKAELTALISLHDVMPETFPRVEQVLERLNQLSIPPIALLVVPGKAWQPEQLERLRQWQSEGYLISAHGWVHRVTKISGAYHWLHSRLISRDVAEHLQFDETGVRELMKKSVSWFPENGLGEPRYYVPPAWAMGPVSYPLEMANLCHVEELGGIRDVKTGKCHKLPLVGFETDTFIREHFVRIWNRFQVRKALQTGKPLRIGLHPQDFQLRLSSELEQILKLPNLTPLDFGEWLLKA